ncbi:MAG: bifunctional glutamate N-acetyltransferase/amino-acid acetyltransferase ArgJ [Peptococcaceae bacterium]|nr:bifunctional glutamate N-acetyltransferase/amino-acid acetyltransferase ArgJ [Peptococcaceae bacterium]
MGSSQKQWKVIQGGIASPTGFYASGVKAGIKYTDKFDVALIKSEVPASAAGVFTRNVVKAHPLLLTEKHIRDGKAQAIIVNSGNANACMGEIGEKAAMQMAEVTAGELKIPVTNVLVSSTGVIGQEMPMDKVIPGIKEAAQAVKRIAGEAKEDIKDEYSHQAALAIMTTDTTVKEMAFELNCSQGPIRLGIMAKGSGMIHPNMGTMLCFITTDAKVEPAMLQSLLKEAADESFNMVTVDGDTSTNDMVVVLANGLSGIEPKEEEWGLFSKMLIEACCSMAIAIARDGEGASKFLEAKVKGARSPEDARKIARSICSSNLVKSAMYGEDANWGRILAAAGYSGAYFNPDKADIFLNGLQVAALGQGLKFPEDEALTRLKNKDILIEIHLQDGNSQACAWGCDLTHKYIDINADYRT